LAFSSGFSGSSLDEAIWETCDPGQPTGCTNFAHDQKQWYEKSQVSVRNGILYLAATRKRTAGLDSQGRPKEYVCRSGRVSTVHGFDFTYGFVQITARIPFGGGLWPALWLAAANRESPPEIDILEHWASEVKTHVFLHPLSGPRQGALYDSPAIDQGWHTFSLYWTSTQLTWYYDGGQVFTTTTGIPQQPMYLIANLAVTNAHPGNCSGVLLIKSVDVWQPALPGPPVSPPPSPPASPSGSPPVSPPPSPPASPSGSPPAGAARPSA
jgi:beta-glucanase (GH16 family)